MSRRKSLVETTPPNLAGVIGPVLRKLLALALPKNFSIASTVANIWEIQQHSPVGYVWCCV